MFIVVETFAHDKDTSHCLDTWPATLPARQRESEVRADAGVVSCGTIASPFFVSALVEHRARRATAVHARRPLSPPRRTDEIAYARAASPAAGPVHGRSLSRDTPARRARGNALVEYFARRHNGTPGPCHYNRWL